MDEKYSDGHDTDATKLLLETVALRRHTWMRAAASEEAGIVDRGSETHKNTTTCRARTRGPQRTSYSGARLRLCRQVSAA